MLSLTNFEAHQLSASYEVAVWTDPWEREAWPAARRMGGMPCNLTLSMESPELPMGQAKHAASSAHCRRSLSREDAPSASPRGHVSFAGTAHYNADSATTCKVCISSRRVVPANSPELPPKALGGFGGTSGFVGRVASEFCDLDSPVHAVEQLKIPMADFDKTSGAVWRVAGGFWDWGSVAGGGATL